MDIKKIRWPQGVIGLAYYATLALVSHGIFAHWRHNNDIFATDRCDTRMNQLNVSFIAQPWTIRHRCMICVTEGRSVLLGYVSMRDEADIISTVYLIEWHFFSYDWKDPGYTTILILRFWTNLSLLTSSRLKSPISKPPRAYLRGMTLCRRYTSKSWWKLLCLLIRGVLISP
jgi:hypothetical protein